MKNGRNDASPPPPEPSFGGTHALTNNKVINIDKFFIFIVL